MSIRQREERLTYHRREKYSTKDTVQGYAKLLQGVSDGETNHLTDKSMTMTDGIGESHAEENDDGLQKPLGPSLTVEILRWKIKEVETKRKDFKNHHMSRK